jgi:hypothetical protein
MMSERRAPPRQRLHRTALILLAVALLLSSFVRARLLALPLERDEGEFAYAGALLLHGTPPYQLAYNMKLPGTYLAYAALMAVFGQTDVGVHLGLMVVNLASIVLLFFWARDLFDPVTAGFTALAYSLLTVSPSVNGMAAHATHFVALFGIAGAWVLWRALRNGRAWLFFTSGLLFGTALVMKQQGVFLSVFGCLTAFVWGSTRRPFAPLPVLVPLVAMLAGAVTPYGVTCLWLWWAGVFGKFWFWTVGYARAYVEMTSPGLGLFYFWRGATSLVHPNWPLWILALIGVAGMGARRASRQTRLFVHALLVFSFLCVCPGLYFRQHYFIVMLPVVALLIGWACTWLLRLAAPRRGQERGPAPAASPPRRPVRSRPAARVPRRQSGGAAADLLRGSIALLLLAALVLPLWWQRGYYFTWPPAKVSRQTYGLAPFVESPAIAKYIREHTRPDQRVAVLGSEPQLYFYSGRTSATGYIYTYGLMEEQPYALKMQQEMIDEIERARPEMIVFVNVPDSWMKKRESNEHIFDWANAYLAGFYDRVGLVDILSADQTEYRWDQELTNVIPRSQYSLWVLRRKSPA